MIRTLVIRGSLFTKVICSIRYTKHSYKTIIQKSQHYWTYYVTVQVHKLQLPTGHPLFCRKIRELFHLNWTVCSMFHQKIHKLYLAELMAYLQHLLTLNQLHIRVCMVSSIYACHKLFPDISLLLYLHISVFRT